MTLAEMKRKVLGLIEELNPESEFLTDDPDIATKINDVINQVMFELARFKKLPRYIEFDVSAGELIDYTRIESECGAEVYQLDNVGGVLCDFKAKGTIIKILESGTLELDFYIYPERITEKTKDKAYEFELSSDVLEIMPYGVASDLLKSDISAEYGKIYEARYRDMLQDLDPRFSMTSVYIDGGVDI